MLDGLAAAEDMASVSEWIRWMIRREHAKVTKAAKGEK